MDVEILDRDGTLLGVVLDGAAEVHPRPPKSAVEDLFLARDELEAAIDAGLEELLGPTKGEK